VTQFPFQNPDLPLDQRVFDLLDRLTVEEKIAQLGNKAPAIPHLGIPAYDWWNECLHGVGRAGRATVFPQAIALSATWNPELVHRVATAISDEARAKYHAAQRIEHHGWYMGLTYWTPTINILRDPRWGRAQETYGEDPFLTAEIAKAFIRGLQGDDPNIVKLTACAKHFAAHSGPEHGRAAFDAQVSPQDLEETYLPAFEATVRESKTLGVMGAYNRLNGVACCADPWLLEQKLRVEWGFDGYVVSDCGAIEQIFSAHKTASSMAEAAAMALKAGCDLCCGQAYQALGSALSEGLISLDDIDRSCERLFRLRFRLGMFDPDEQNPYAAIPESVVECPEHRALAKEAAIQSLVLLKNDGILPLSPQTPRIAVVGPGIDAIDVLWGNYQGTGSQLTTLLEGITGAVSVGTRLIVAKGCDWVGEILEHFPGTWEVRDADLIIACIGLSPKMEGEEGDALLTGGDKPIAALAEVQVAFLNWLKTLGKPIVAVVTGGSPIGLDAALECANAVLLAWYPGCEGGNAVAEVLFGKQSPGGRLPASFPRADQPLPPIESYAMEGRTYRFQTETPLFNFGDGLGYTTVTYQNRTIKEFGDGWTVSVEIKNTGNRPASEVVQLYIRELDIESRTPRHHLEGFQRVTLAPQEQTTVSIPLSPRSLTVVSPQGERTLPPGKRHVFIGGSQPTDQDVPLELVL
jgi:beta-glucosidase